MGRFARLSAAALAVSLAGGAGLFGAGVAQAAPVPDDPAAYAVGLKFDIGYGTADADMMWIGSQKNPNPTGLRFVNCIEPGVPAGTATSLGAPLTGQEASWLAYLQAKQEKDPANVDLHVATEIVAYNLFSPEGAVIVRNAPDPRLTKYRALADQLLAEGKANGGPYTAPAPGITVNNDGSGTGAVTVTAPVSAAGNVQAGHEAHVTLTGAVFADTGLPTARLAQGVTAAIKGVAAGTKPTVTETFHGLPSADLIAFRNDSQQDTTVTAGYVGVSAQAQGFRKFDQDVRTNIVLRGEYGIADEIERFDASPDSSAEVISTVIITGEKATKEGVAMRPADAVDIQTIVTKVDGNGKVLMNQADNAKVEAAVKAFQEKNNGAPVTVYIQETIQEDALNRAHVGNHLLQAESLEYPALVKPEPSAPAPAPEVKTVVQKVEVPVVNAGYAVPVAAPASAGRVAAVDGGMLTAGGVALAVALTLGLSAAVRARKADRS